MGNPALQRHFSSKIPWSDGFVCLHMTKAATKLCQRTSKNSLEEIVELARQDIAQIAGVSVKDAETLHVVASVQLFPAQKLRKSMLDIFNQSPPRKLSTGCDIMDSALGGGISSGCGLVEVCYAIISAASTF